MPPRNPPWISPRTLGRRDWLEWLGKAAVVSLSAPWLVACAEGPGRADAAPSDGTAPDAGGRRGDAAAPPGDAHVDARAPEADGPRGDTSRRGDTGTPGDADADAARTADQAAPDVHDAGARPEVGPEDGGGPDFAFEPGAGVGSPYDRWPVRTVDPQDVAAILGSWRLVVDGLCAAPRTFTFADLLALPRQDQTTDFHCVEGWTVFDVPWNGVVLATLLDLVQPWPTASQVTFHTLGGRYNESLPLAVAREPRTLLGFGVNGATLPLEHGFPLRLVVPRLLGYKNAKYVARIELDNAPREGFWVKYGYPYAGEVDPARLREGKY